MPITTGHRVGSTPLSPNIRAFQAINGGAVNTKGQADEAVSSTFGVRGGKRPAPKRARAAKVKKLTPVPTDGDEQDEPETETPPAMTPTDDTPAPAARDMRSGDLLETFNTLIGRMPSHPVIMKVPTKSGFVTHKISCRQFKYDAEKRQLKFLFDSQLFDFSYGDDEQVEVQHGSVRYACNYVVTLEFVEGSPWRCAIFIAESSGAASVTGA